MATKEEQVAEAKALYEEASPEDRARMMTMMRALHSGQITAKQVRAVARSGDVRAFADELASRNGGRAQA